MYVCKELEISGFSSPNAKHFWGNCASLWPIDSPNFFDTADHLWPIANHFSNGFGKTFFLSPPYSRQILAVFDKFYKKCKSANKLRIMISNLRINLKSDSQCMCVCMHVRV